MPPACQNLRCRVGENNRVTDEENRRGGVHYTERECYELKTDAKLQADGDRSGMIVAEADGHGKGNEVGAAVVSFKGFVQHGRKTKSASRFKRRSSRKRKAFAKPEQNARMKQEIGHFGNAFFGTDGWHDLDRESDLWAFPKIQSRRKSDDVRVSEVWRGSVFAECRQRVQNSHVARHARVGRRCLGGGGSREKENENRNCCYGFCQWHKMDFVCHGVGG